MGQQGTRCYALAIVLYLQPTQFNCSMLGLEGKCMLLLQCTLQQQLAAERLIAL